VQSRPNGPVLVNVAGGTGGAGTPSQNDHHRAAGSILLWKGVIVVSKDAAVPAEVVLSRWIDRCRLALSAEGWRPVLSPSKSWGASSFREYHDVIEALKADQAEIADDFKVGLLRTIAESRPEVVVHLLVLALKRGLQGSERRRVLHALNQLVLDDLEATGKVDSLERARLEAQLERAQLEVQRRRVQDAIARLNHLKAQVDKGVQ